LTAYATPFDFDELRAMCALLLSVKSGSEESKGWSLLHGAFFRNEEVQHYVPPW